METDKAKIVLSHEAFSIIEHLTKTCTTEIAAVGTVSIQSHKVGDEGDEDSQRYFYVDKLYFPDQEVSGATVKIEPQDWMKVIRDIGVDKMGDIAFYWHRHPGSSNHSHTDKEDTFDVFMSKDAAKPHFLFLQTAIGSNGKMNTEARIELRSPIKATIPHTEIQLRKRTQSEEDVTPINAAFTKSIESLWKKYAKELKPMGLTDVELTEAKEEYLDMLGNYRKTFKVKTYCDMILKDRIKVQTYEPTTTNDTQYSDWWDRKKNRNNDKHFNTHPALTDSNMRQYRDIQALKQLFNVDRGGDYIDNQFIDGMATTEDEQASLDVNNGNITILAGEKFNKIMEVVTSKTGILSSLLNRDHLKVEKKKGIHKWTLHPAKKSFYPLREKIKILFVSYNKQLLDILEKRERDLEPSISAQQTLQGTPISQYKVNDCEEDVDMLLETITASFKVEWTKDFAQVFDCNGKDYMGTLQIQKEGAGLTITGRDLVEFAKIMIDDMPKEYTSEYQLEDAINASYDKTEEEE